MLDKLILLFKWVERNIIAFITFLIFLFVFVRYLVPYFFDSLDTFSSSLSSSLSSEDAEEKIDILKTAMDGLIGWGTDYQAIKSVLTGLSSNDFEYLSDKFGTPMYSILWGGSGDYLTASPLSLLGWLNEELTRSQKNDLKLLLPFLDF